MLATKDSNRLSKANKLSKVEQKLLQFEERKQVLELKAIRDQQQEDKMVHDLLMDRRQKQIEQLKENKEFMDEWMKKGRRDWTNNNKVTLERIRKQEIHEKALTDKYINTIKQNMQNATEDVVNGIESFENNLARMGIENEANIDALDESKKQPAASKKLLGGFSFPATMIKIKEKKDKGDQARKERDRRRRILQVVQAQTQEQVKLKTRKEELLTLITAKTKDEIKHLYIHWRLKKCQTLEQQNLKRVNEDHIRKRNMELKRIEDELEKGRDHIIKQYKNS